MKSRNKVPVGLCQCGCGRNTRISKKTDRRAGWVKGRPLRFICGHNLEAHPRELSPSWKGENVGYVGAHKRLGPVKGTCVDCPARATEWSLNRNAATKKIQRGGKYNGYVFSLRKSDFAGRCHPCHAKYDAYGFPKGEAHPLAALTEAKVRQIRNRVKAGGPRGYLTALAAKFSISPTTISRIKSGKTWRHVA